jgi:hypothetical protein
VNSGDVVSFFSLKRNAGFLEISEQGERKTFNCLSSVPHQDNYLTCLLLLLCWPVVVVESTNEAFFHDSEFQLSTCQDLYRQRSSGNGSAIEVGPSVEFFPDSMGSGTDSLELEVGMTMSELANFPFRQAMENLPRAHGRSGRRVMPSHPEQGTSELCRTCLASQGRGRGAAKGILDLRALQDTNTYREIVLSTTSLLQMLPTNSKSNLGYFKKKNAAFCYPLSRAAERRLNATTRAPNQIVDGCKSRTSTSNASCATPPT